MGDHPFLYELEQHLDAVPEEPERQYRRVRNLVVLLTVIFLIGSVAGLVAFQYSAESLVNDQILGQARAHASEFEAVRLYVSSFGGVYIPSSTEETANPHLKGVPGREAAIETTFGRTFVLRNSPLVAAGISHFMLGLDKEHSVTLRMASEHPLNPSNRPDKFEGTALATFRAQRTLKEEWRFESSGEDAHFRYASPIKAEKPCVRCHPDVKNEIGRPFAVMSVDLDVTSAIGRTRTNRWWIVAMVGALVLAAYVGMRFFVMRVLNNLRDSQMTLFELARTDSLTGLPNTRMALARLAEELSRCQREGEKLAIAMLDLDDFKKVNDTLGHAAGDEALRWNRDRKFPADQLHSLGLTGRMVELAIAKDELLEEVRSQLDGTLSVLQYLVADKRPDYSQHAMRVSRLAGDIARQMGMPTHTRKSLRLAGLIHDVGIMALPPDLAVSGQPLSIEAQLLIKQHPRIGSELANVANFNSDVQEAVGGHHERLDGSGYPDALRGDSIPPSARIMAVCEVFDSMTHRTYHSDSAEQSAVDELRTNAGRLYDSKVVSALLDCIAAQDLVADDLVLPELGTSAIDEPSAVGDDELIETDSTF